MIIVAAEEIIPGLDGSSLSGSNKRGKDSEKGVLHVAGALIVVFRGYESAGVLSTHHGLLCIPVAALHHIMRGIISCGPPR